MRRFALIWTLGLLLMAGCDSENVSWAFISNPSGSGSFGTGGGVIIIRTSSSSYATTGTDPRFVTVSGADDRGAVTAHLLVGGDVALLERTGGIEVRSPVLSTSVVELDGARLNPTSAGAIAAELTLPDASMVDPGAFGTGRLSIAAEGTLLVLEHQGGVTALGAGLPVYAPSGTIVQTIGDDLALLTPDSRLERLLAVPPAPDDARLRRPASGRLELLGPRGEVLAAVPDDPVILHDGAGGLFLTATFPEGVGSERFPIALTMAAHDRYLLRIE